MSIPRERNEVLDKEHEHSAPSYAYACGHRDARHAAAEIAAEGDALVEELTKALDRMCSVWVTVCNSKGLEPEHMSQYTDARAVLAKVRG